MKLPKQIPTIVASTARNGISKARSGISGLDEIMGGGFPRGTATLLLGGAGAGKTLLALQSLVNGARQFDEPGIFVAFEEASKNIVAHADFGWDIPALPQKSLFFLDAMPSFDLVQSGSFDLSGMLAALDAQVSSMGAARIVFDAIDIVLTLLDDSFAQRREVHRLHDWLQTRRLTAIITSKIRRTDAKADHQAPFEFMQFMADCSIVLHHRVVQGVSQRSLQVLKYRGSSFEENEAPFVISGTGFEVAATHALERGRGLVTDERVSSGVERLDTMLGGGFYRSAAVIITGFPGTAKSTLCGAFSEAACARGERTLFVSFDSDAGEVVRNLASVNVRLERFLKNGMLRIVSARAIAGSAEIHLMHIRSLVQQHGARCVVIDPISALSKIGNESTAHGVAERLIDWAKAEDITLVCTSLVDDASPSGEGTAIQISTIADTWIHLNYLVRAGERNRGLSIVKSRGTAHSNQVRELILSETGITLADAYTAAGEVLMGTLRWEKEMSQLRAEEETVLSEKRSALRLDIEEAELEARVMLLQRELDAKRTERDLQAQLDSRRESQQLLGRSKMHELRLGDAKIPPGT
ncbi:circadian clock protein KaiC [Bradyrhizobium sp.]|jgi:circadian clock protein KaiC|uniref:circadian clock protein KaiC n=1 Tax=Bradyrhizobium sp. TaxID=376 RepID=UPI003C20DCFD